MRRWASSTVVLVLTLAAASGAHAAASPTSAAVLVTEATSVNDFVLERVRVLAHEAASNSALVVKHDPQGAEDTLRAAGLNPRSCGASAECISRLGRALGVRYLVALGVASFADLSAITVDIVDTLSGEVVGHKERTGVPADILASLPGELVRQALPVALRHAPSRLAVACNVEGASVFIDGAKVGTTPLAEPINVQPGEHEILVEAAGYQPHRSAVRVTKGEREVHNALLFPSPESAAPEAKAARTSPPRPDPYAEARRPATGWTTYQKAAIGTGAAAVAALGGGVALALAMQRDERDYYLACAHEYGEDCHELDALPWDETGEMATLRRSANRKGILATTAFGVAGAAAITTGLLLFLSPSQEKTSEAGFRELSVVPRPGGFAIGASGTF